MEISEDPLFYIDLFASILGVVYILLATKQNNWCWPAAAVSSGLYVYLFIVSKLYFDAILNFYYVVMAFYGLYSWNKISESSMVNIKWSSTKNSIIGVIGCLIVSFILGFIAKNYTDADFAYADAFTTVFSFYATWLITQKRIENWLFWIVINAIALVMYYLKGLNFTVVLFAVYLGFSVFGFFTWRKELKQA